MLLFEECAGGDAGVPGRRGRIIECLDSLRRRGAAVCEEACGVLAARFRGQLILFEQFVAAGTIPVLHQSSAYEIA